MATLSFHEVKLRLPHLLAWRRLRATLFVTVPLGLLLGATTWTSGLLSVLGRTVLLGALGVLVFGLLERWPPRLPRRVPRWALQVVGVGFAMPVSVFWIYVFTTRHGAPPWWRVPDRVEGFWTLTLLGLLIAPWFALGALVREKEAFAREQALAFDLERSELGRQAVDARLRLLQAQVAPHFLFNTLANVQALVDAGSPQAAVVLRSLVAYLRAAVPRLDEPVATLGEEVDLVRSYLELMHMRIPDRLTYSIDLDDAARTLRCAPMTLLTLVENAVRHGIDPAEEGGRIEIRILRHGARCLVRVDDTGVGLGGAAAGLGTGLATLRERLELAFAGDARLAVSPRASGGVRAEIDLPALERADA